MKYLPLQSYQYAGNRPISLSDPSGLEWYDIDGKGTWEYSKDTPTRFVVRTNDEGKDVLTEVAGQKELLFFDGSSLTWMADDGSTMTWEAVSGELENGMTNPALQIEKDRGPVPEGDYFVDFRSTVQRQDLDILRSQVKYPQSSWGNYFVAIHPRQLPSGRGGFFIHGGDVPGSKGCIDLHRNNDSFFGMMISKNKSLMPLFVRYRLARVLSGLTGLGASVLILESAMNIIRFPQNFLPDEQALFGKSEVAVVYYFALSSLTVTLLLLALSRKTSEAWHRYHIALFIVLGLIVAQIVFALMLHKC